VTLPLEDGGLFLDLHKLDAAADSLAPEKGFTGSSKP